jgi:hypothetical protein
MAHRELEKLSVTELAAGIARVHSEMSAVRAKLLGFVRDFDARGCWRGDGATSMAQWLVATQHVPYRTAAEWVRTSHALTELPVLSEASSEGPSVSSPSGRGPPRRVGA